MKFNRRFVDGEFVETQIAEEDDTVTYARDLDFSDQIQPRTPEQRRAHMHSLGQMISRPREEALDMLFTHGIVPSENRALGETTDAAGAVLVANTKPGEIIELVSKATHPILDAATLFPTATGGDCVSPADDDFADTSAGVVGENVTSDMTADIVFSAITWPKVQTIRCGFILVPIELPNIRVVLPPILGRRLGRRLAALAVTAVAAGADVSSTVASATAITLPELKSLKAAVDAAHQASGSWVMNPLVYDSMVALTTTGEYEFDPQGNPTLLGKRCFLEPAMPLMTAGLKPISYGDHSALIRREVIDSMVLRSFPERFAERGQSCYELYARVDFALAKGSATPVPVKVLAMHA